MISVLDRRVPARGRTPDRAQPWVSARSAGDLLLLVLVALVALVVYAVHGTHGYLERDLGVFLYGGEHVARGVPPYTGIFNSVGPLADAVPGLAVWLGDRLGMPAVTSARLFFLLLSVGCVLLVYATARQVLGSRATGVVAAAVFLTFTRFLELASDGPREKTTMVLALLGCLFFLGRRRFLAAGLCTALATLTWQPVLAPCLAAAATAVLLDRRGSRGGDAVAFLAGGVLPSAVTVCWFALTGTLPTAIRGFLLINLLDTHQPSPVLHPFLITHTLWHAYGPTLLLVPVGVVSLLLLAVRDRRLRVTAAGAVAATAWSAAVLNGGPDLFVVLPFAAIGVAALVGCAALRLSPRVRTVLLVAVTGAAVAAATVESVATRSDLLVAEQADIGAVLATQPRSATVLSIDTPEVLALAGRDNPTPYQLFSRTMERYLDGLLPGGMQGYSEYVADLRPTFVTVGQTYGGLWPDRVLAEDYWRVGRGPGWIWYLSREAGRAALLRARTANDSAMGEPPPGGTGPGSGPGTRLGVGRAPRQSAPT